MTVIIDPGHGGSDVGATSLDGTYDEKHINLTVAKYLQSYLKSAGVNVIMVRDTLEDGSDLTLRGAVMERYQDTADLFFSIHHNAANTAARGAGSVGAGRRIRTAARPKFWPKSCSKSTAHSVCRSARSCSARAGQRRLLLHQPCRGVALYPRADERVLLHRTRAGPEVHRQQRGPRSRGACAVQRNHVLLYAGRILIKLGRNLL